MRTLDNHKTDAYYICIEPNDGTRYSLHIVSDRWGGWLITWKEGKAIFWVDSDLSELKSIVNRNPYNEDIILRILNYVPWGVY